MSENIKISSCPYCKSNKGYEYKFSTEYIQHNDWDNQPVNAEQTGNGTTKKTKKCVDCGKM